MSQTFDQLAGILLDLAAIAAALMGHPYLAAALMAAGAGSNYAAGEAGARKAAQAARDAYNASLKNQAIMVRGSVAPSMAVYGRTRVSGPILYVESTGANDSVLWVVVGLCKHQIDAVEQIYFDNTPISIDGSGYVTTAPWSTNTANSSAFLVDHATIAPGVYTYPLTKGPSGSGIVSLGKTAAANGYTGEIPLTYGTHYSWSGPNIVLTSAVVSAYPGYIVNVFYGYSNSNVLARVKIHLGTPSQAADPDLVGASAGLWTAAHQLKGCAYLVVRLQYDQNAFPTGIPNISATVRGKLVYDPRTSTTAWSNNAALCVRDYLTTGGGMGISTANIDDASVIASANVCDGNVQINSSGATASGLTLTIALATNGFNWTIARTAGSNISDGFAVGQLVQLSGAGLNAANIGRYLQITGVSALVLTVATLPGAAAMVAQSAITACTQTVSLYQQAYTIDGCCDTGSDRASVLDVMVRAMGGAAYYSQGKWRMRAGANVTATLTLNESNLADGTVQINPFLSRRDLINGCRGKFLDSSQAFNETDFPEWKSATYLAQDGGTYYPLDMSFPMTTDVIRAQRLAKIAVLSARNAYTIVAICNLSMYQASVADGVSVSIARYGISGVTFRIIDRQLNDKMQVVLTLKIDPAGLYSWTLGEQGTVPVSPSAKLPTPQNIAAPSILGVTTGESVSITNPDGTVNNRILLSLNACTIPQVLSGGYVEVQYLNITGNGWTSLGNSDPNQTLFYIGGCTVGLQYQIRVRYQGGSGASSDWTYATTTLAAGKVSLPAAPTSLSVTQGANNTRTFTWSMPILPADVVSFELRYQAGTSFTWGSATQLGIIPVGVIGSLLTWIFQTTQPEASGTYSFGVLASRSDGTQSTVNSLLNVALNPAGAAQAALITGTINDAQIAGLAASKVTGTLTDAQLSAISAAKVTGTLTDSQIAALAAAKLTGTLTTTQIGPNTIQAANIGAGQIYAGALAAGSVLASNLTVGGGGNLVTNGEMNIDDPTAFWQSGYLIDGTWGFGAQGDPWKPISVGGVYTTSPSNYSGITDNTLLADIYNAVRIPCSPGDTYEVSCWMSAHRCRAQVKVWYYTAAGVEVAETGGNVIVDNEIGWPTNTRSGCFFTIPAGAQYMNVGARCYSYAANGNNPYMFISQVYLGPAYPNQSVLSAFSPSGVTRISGGQLQASSVTAAQIAANTITAAQIAAGTITATQLAAGSVQAGRLAAGAVQAGNIAAGAIVVGDGVIQNAYIDTLKIQGNAVTVPVSAIYNSTLNIPKSTVTAILSAPSITGDGVTPYQIVVSVPVWTWSIATGENWTIDILDNGAGIWTFNLWALPPGSIYGWQPPLSVAINVTPSAAAHVYSIQGTHLTTTGNIVIRTASITVTGFKR